MELELICFLDKENKSTIKERNSVIHHHKQMKSDIIEKMFLARSIPLLAKSKNIQKKIIESLLQTDYEKKEKEIVLHYQKKIAALQDEIHNLTSYQYQLPEIEISSDKCIDVVYGASAGGCCGGTTGAMGICTLGTLEAYAWCCCNMSHSKILWDILIWGLPIATGSGCCIGACCVLSGLYEKIKLV